VRRGLEELPEIATVFRSTSRSGWRTAGVAGGPGVQGIQRSRFNRRGQPTQPLDASFLERQCSLFEKDSFNVRSAFYHLKKDGVGIEFLLFPMIHVGSQFFYDEVANRLNTCDLILAEGVSSKRASLLTLSYRIVKRIKRMDLVTQGDRLVLSTFADRIVDSDMTGHAFDERWSSLPLLFRAHA
jgi:hypothetical protein